MPDSDKANLLQLRNDFERQPRSSSPAVKRPASDMGAQDREDHTEDVEMEGTLDSANKAKQQDTGQRNQRPVPPLSQTVGSSPPLLHQQNPSSEVSSMSTLDTSNHITSTSSTTATSVMAEQSSVREAPSIDEQVEIVTRAMDKPLQDEQKGFVVSTKWLNRVLARSHKDTSSMPVDKSATEGAIGPVDSSDLVIITDDTSALSDEAGEPFAEMRPGLVKGEDFRVLPQDAWQLVIEWYGQRGPTIVRYAHETVPGADADYEIYPPIFILLKVPFSHTVETQRAREEPPKRMLASRKTLFQKWLQDAKQLLGVPLTTKVRPWKILGGLKNSDASGMLTPVASRGSSPAPGAELVVQTGGHMLLDVNTFTTLRVGDQRELVNAKDQTANDNYNGKSDTLEKEGLSRNEVIVLEEQGQAEKWASDKAPFKTVAGKVKSHLTVGDKGTALHQGPMTRGRGRSSRSKGITGLGNLGNTCYMNSALQCIRSVQELTEYFLRGYWKRDLNSTNLLGHHGNVARAYGDLLKKLYEGDVSSFSPSHFKNVVGRYGPNFAGYGQQDSQEFLLFLIDGLQEDLNRALDKPYMETPDSTDEMVHDPKALKAFADQLWDHYKKRNDSVVTDLFAGMYKSTVTCPVCKKVSISFDPFSTLTLPLPMVNTWAKEVLYFPLHKHPIKIEVEVDKFASVGDVKKFVQKKTGVPTERLVMAESYKSRFYKIFSNYTVISEAGIQKGDVIVLHELSSVPTDYDPDKVKKQSTSIYSRRDSSDEMVDINSPAADRLLVPVFHRRPKHGNKSIHVKELFGEPAYVVIGRDEAKSYDRVLQLVLGSVMTMTTMDILQDEGLVSAASISPEGSDTVVMEDEQNSEIGNVHAASVQGEDGLVDISMRDSPSDNSPGSVLRPGASIPPRLRNMFTLRIAPTTEGLHTGWNDITESNEYELLSKRTFGKAYHPVRGGGALGVVNGTNESSGSDGDSSDIPHGPTTPADSTSSGTGTQSFEPSDDDLDQPLPSVNELIRRNKVKRTYSKKEGLGRDKSTRQIHDTALVRPHEAIVLDWSPGTFDALFTGDANDPKDIRGCATWISAEMKTMEDAELMALRQKRSIRKKRGISLEECLDDFGKPETLSENNAWSCPRCEKKRRAEKRLELWKVPDILVVHLKRFSNRNWREKVDVFVDYPVEGLDMTRRVIDREGKSLVYDLIAVDNHYGGIGGGHYTAFAKNFCDDNWYEYNGEFTRPTM